MKRESEAAMAAFLDSSLSHRSKTDRLKLFEIRKLMRAAFYADLNRRPPTSTSHMPSYVRVVKRKWGMQYNNSARQLLAEIEGFPDWETMMRSE